MVLSLYWFASLFIIKCAHKKIWESHSDCSERSENSLDRQTYQKKDAHSVSLWQTRTRLETFRAVNTNMFFFFWSSVPEGKDERSYRERHFTIWCLNCHSVSKPFLRWPNTNTVVYLGVCITRHWTQHLILLICTSCHHSLLKIRGGNQRLTPSHTETN